MGELSFDFIQLPSWVTWELVFHILDSKLFSAIYWGAAAVVAIIGFVARMKYRDRNLKHLLDGYVEKARKADIQERQSVKGVIGRAIQKARGQRARGRRAAQFHPSNVFEDAARYFAQSQAPIAMGVLRREAQLCEAAINHAEQQVRHTRMRAATAFLQIGSMLREQPGKEGEALNAFLDMERVSPNDPDALRMLGTQYRELNRYGEAEQYLTKLLAQTREVSVIADIKRELGLVFIGANDTRAEGVLQEALAIEQEARNQRGEARTYELLGVARSRFRWGLARRAYNASKAIFRMLNDTESVARVQGRLTVMELQRRAEKRRARRRTPPREDAVATVH
jgi:tetratricopeptide (TPR) repeat protein